MTKEKTVHLVFILLENIESKTILLQKNKLSSM